jgi:hypothetical protein
MPLDPSIILGARPAQFDMAQFSPMNAMTGVMKFKQLDQENRINALKMQEYERARTEEEGLRNYLAEADFAKPETRTNLLRYGKAGAAQAEALSKQDTAALTQRKAEFEIQKSRKDFIAQAQRDTSQNPSDANITAYKEDLMANPLFTNAEKAQMAKGADRILAMPVDQRQQFMASQGASASELKPTTFAQDLGPSGRLMSRSAFGGPATVVPGSEYTKGKTFADLTSEKQATTSAGQLGLAQAKFKFEQANPTMSIQEDPSGLLAVNTRTGVATPVVYGPMGIQAAPAAAPTAAPVAGPSVMRQQGAGMPGERVAAIPGMASVLDRTAAPAAMPVPAEVGARMPGMPVGSKKEAPVKFNDTDLQLAGLAGSLKDFKDEVNKNLFTGAKFLPSGADTAAMTSKYTALLMGVKDLYTLGALTGPDMSIIESQITNPASWSGKFTTKQGFNEQTKVIEDMLKRSTTNLETTYGRVPKASKKAIETMSSGGSGNNAIPNATATNPLGLKIPGVK